MSSIHVEVTDQVLDTQALLAHAADPSFGAQTLFVGVVRNLHAGRKVLAVSYDAFTPLCEKVFREICQEAEQKWGPLSLTLVHRTGRLGVGEASVVIAVGSPHRDESYLASRYLIEELKVRAPIWKKEHYEDGETEWLRGHALCGHADRARNRSCGGTLEPHGH